MDKHAPTIERLHHSAKGTEILWSGSFEIHWNMDVRHAEASNDTPLMGKSVIRRWECEVDDRLKAGLANGPKLTLGGLASRAKVVSDGTETINLRQHGW